MRLIDLTGMRFGRLTVMRRTEQTIIRAQWWCLCDCGAKTKVYGEVLRRGNARSCGCLRRDAATTHGMSKSGSAAYKSWRAMRSRCESPNHSAYKCYGGRGIKVCERWMVFENFLADMGEPPAGMTIERINNDAGYSPENCKWATRAEQANNRRGMLLLTLNGETMCLTAWAKRKGINNGTLAYRVRSGWSAQKALTTPINQSMSRK